MNAELLPSNALVCLPPAGSDQQKFHPLFLKIYGLTLLERTLRALERAGLSRIVVLAGKDADGVESLLKKTAPWTAAVEVVRGEGGHFSIPSSNGSGWLIVAEPVVLDPQVIRPMLEKGKAHPGSLVRTGDGRLAFADDATLARLFQGGFLHFKLSNFTPSVLFAVSPPLLGVRDSRELRFAKQALRRSLVKPSDGWVSKNLNRPVSISISRVLARTSVTPNQFTIFAAILGLVTGFVLAMGGYWGFFAGAAMFHLTSVLDGVDGELARLKFKSSPLGQWLDTLADNSSYVFALAGFLVGMLRDGASDFEKTAGAAALLFTVLALGSMYTLLRRSGKGGSLLHIDWGYEAGRSRFDTFILKMGAFGRRDLFALIFFGLGVIGQLRWALVYIAILTAMLLGFSIRAHFRTAGKAILAAG